MVTFHLNKILIQCVKWHPFPYIEHYLFTGSIGLWSKIIHCIDNKEDLGWRLFIFISLVLFLCPPKLSGFLVFLVSFSQVGIMDTEAVYSVLMLMHMSLNLKLCGVRTHISRTVKQ